LGDRKDGRRDARNGAEHGKDRKAGGLAAHVDHVLSGSQDLHDPVTTAQTSNVHATDSANDDLLADSEGRDGGGGGDGAG